MSQPPDDLFSEASLGELRARHREEHLCLRCSHQHVCKMAAALDANFLPTIAFCLAYEPAEADDNV